jgi:hypothetical protein
MRTRAIMSAARRDGRQAGKNAASWCFDIARLPLNYAASATSRTLQENYDVADDRWNDLGGDVCDAWIDAATTAFWDEIERVCRYQVKP